MSLLGEIVRARPRAQSITTSRELWESLQRGAQTEGGEYITPDRAMRMGAAFACVRVLGETVGVTPSLVYERQANGTRTRATGHWAYTLLHEQPNEWQTPLEFKEMLTAHAIQSGAGYALKTVVRGEVRELLPIVPSRVTVEQDPTTKRIWFDVTMPDGTTLPVPRERMFHLPFMTLDGVRGVSLVSYQRELLSLGLQQAKYNARMLRNGAHIGGVIEMPVEHPTMSDPAYERLVKTFDEKYSGLDRTGKTVLLEEGATFKATGMTAADAQFLEAMKYNWVQTCAVYRVPPRLTGHREGAGVGNAEQEDIEFLKYTMLPWFTRWEQRFGLELIPRAERRRFYVEFLADALLRGDSKSRAQYFRTAIMSGWMNRQEVRLRENFDPGPPELEEFIQPLNVQPVGSPPVDPPPGREENDDA